MGRKRIADELLSLEQLKRRARNDRYRAKFRQRGDMQDNLTTHNIDASKTKRTIKRQTTEQRKPLCLTSTLAMPKRRPAQAWVVNETLMPDESGEIMQSSHLNETLKTGSAAMDSSGSKHLHLVSTPAQRIERNETLVSEGATESHSVHPLPQSQKLAATNETGDASSFRWRDFQTLIVSPAAFFLSFLVLAFIALLTYFQAQAYLHADLGQVAWHLALGCEIGLLALTVLFSLRKARFLAGILFLGLFAYSLGTMTFDLVSEQRNEVSALENGNEKSGLIKDSLVKAQRALEEAMGRKESGNIAKHAKVVEELTVLYANSDHGDVEAKGLVQTKFNGLIFLRALLMLINALLIHNLIALMVPLRKVFGEANC